MDWSKRHPTSLFYVPSQAENRKPSFFTDYNEVKRQPLDPVTWIENSPSHLQPEAPIWDGAADYSSTEIDPARINSAITDWRNTPKGQGNAGFYTFARECRRAGMDLQQIESLLTKEAEFGRSPKERKAQIASILKGLRERQIP